MGQFKRLTVSPAFHIQASGGSMVPLESAQSTAFFLFVHTRFSQPQLLDLRYILKQADSIKQALARNLAHLDFTLPGIRRPLLHQVCSLL